MLIGRENEKIEIETAIDSDKSEFVAVYGRRRVGKTFLIREVCNYSFSFEHTGQFGKKRREIVSLRQHEVSVGGICGIPS